MSELAEQDVHEMVGDEGFARICKAFYEQIPKDEILGPMYLADDLEGAEQRLRDFLIYRFGGPPKYIEVRGHPRLRMRHAPFKIDRAARDRWMEMMGRAVAQAEIDPQAAELLLRFFDAMATFLINRAEE